MIAGHLSVRVITIVEVLKVSGLPFISAMIVTTFSVAAFESCATDVLSGHESG